MVHGAMHATHTTAHGGGRLTKTKTNVDEEGRICHLRGGLCGRLLSLCSHPHRYCT